MSGVAETSMMIRTVKKRHWKKVTNFKISKNATCCSRVKQKNILTLVLKIKIMKCGILRDIFNNYIVRLINFFSSQKKN